MPDTEQTIYSDFEHRGLTILEAVERLERIGYSHQEAEEQVFEWADELEARERDQ